MSKNFFVLSFVLLFAVSVYPQKKSQKNTPSVTQKTVKVSNVSQFIKAIAPNTRIELKRGIYNISDVALAKNRYITWENPHDGYEPTINNVENLTISGEVGARILIEPRYAFVLSFKNSKNIAFENVILGHTEGGYCLGGVLYFFKSEEIRIENSILYGSGKTGLELDGVINLKMLNSQIKECTYEIMSILDSRDIIFERSIFQNNREFNLINIDKSNDIKFSSCTIESNQVGDDETRDSQTYMLYLFNINESKGIEFYNSQVFNNKAKKFVTDRNAILLSSNTFRGNTFTDFNDEELSLAYDDRTPPTIEILEPVVKERGVGVVVQEKEIIIRGKAFDKSGIYEVTVNGSKASILPNGEFKAQPKLIIGNNTITIRVVDTKQNASEKSFTIQRKDDVNSSTASSSTEFGTYHALIIGVQDYIDDSINDLDNPILDAEKLRLALTQNYTFDERNVTLLKNPDLKTIVRELNGLRRRLTSNDNLLIFFAGHGYWDKEIQQGYWLPSDASSDDTSKWLSNSSLSDYIRGVRAKHILLVSDACFSGGIFKTKDAFADSKKVIQEIYALPSRKAITSGALETVPDKSVFTQYLVKRLEQNSVKYLDSQRLYVSLREAVINNSPTTQKPLYGAIHLTGDEGGDFIFIHK